MSRKRSGDRAHQYSLGELFAVATGPSHFAFGISLLDVLAAVMGLAASSNRYFDLGSAILEIHLQRHNGQWLRGEEPSDFVDFLAMSEKFAFAIGVVAAEAHGKSPWRDVGLEKPQFTVFDATVTVADLGLAFAQALYFGATENEAAFERSQDFVVVASSTIGRDGPVAVAARSSSRPLCLFTLCSSHVSSVPRGSDGITRGERWHF